MLFELDLEVLRSYVYLFSYFFYVSFFSYYVLKPGKKVIYFAPFMYILMGLYSGFNFYFFMLFFVIVGIEITIKYKKKLGIILIYLIYLSYFGVTVL